MAKSKKKKNVALKYAKYLNLLLSALIIVMAFLPFVIYESDNSSNNAFTGFEVAFGKTLNSISFLGFASGTAKIDMSYLLIVALFVPLVGSVIAMLIKNRKLGILLACVCFIVSAILIFMTLSITSITVSGNVITIGGSSTETFAQAGYSLAIGAILAGVLSSLGALTSVANIVLK